MAGRFFHKESNDGTVECWIELSETAWLYLCSGEYDNIQLDMARDNYSLLTLYGWVEVV